MAENQKHSLLIKVAKVVDSISYRILYVCLIAMTIFTVGDTLLRSFTNLGIGGIAEGSTYLLVLLGFLGIARTQSFGGHIEVNFLTSHFSTSVNYYLKKVIGIGLILFSILFVYAGTLKAISAFTTRESDWFGIHILPVWFFRFAVPIGFCLLIIELLVDLFEVRSNSNEQDKTA